MTKKYSIKKKNNNWQSSLLVILGFLLIASAALLINLSKKPRIELKQIDMNLKNDSQALTNSFTIAIFNEAVLDTKVINKTIDKNEKYLTILKSLRENMDWPAAVRVDRVIELEHRQKKYVIVNLAIDRSVAIDISIGKEKDILDSIAQTLKLNGADDYRILVNDKESKLFIKNLGLKIGLD